MSWLDVLSLFLAFFAGLMVGVVAAGLAAASRRGGYVDGFRP